MELSTKINKMDCDVDVYDDDKSTAYLKIEPFTSAKEALASLIIKKRKWEEKNPTKKIVTIATIPCYYGFGSISLDGLLIHYEQR